MWIIGILFLGYGISLCMLESSQWYRILWFVIGIGLIISAVLPGMPEWIKTCFRIGAAGILFMIAVMSILNLLTIRKGMDKAADVILVLGCKIGSRGFHFRANAAANYLHHLPEASVICCGGQGSDEPCTEAEQFAREIKDAGIEEERIKQERTSVSTAENIRNSLSMIPDQKQPVGIVSSDYHMYRSVAIAKKQGLSNAFGIPSGSVWFYVPDYTLREALACIKGLLKNEL